MSLGPGEGHVPADGARLYYRTVGKGRPLIVLHGGPDFDHNYLLPELDRLAELVRLVYYDQRGRGRSAKGVAPADVGIDSELADLDRVRRHFGFDSFALLGHSWGALLAMEYAIRRPQRVSHLILMNAAPASAKDASALRQHLARARPAEAVERMEALAASPCYQAGDLETDAEYYRIHFAQALRHSERLEELVSRLRAHFSEESLVAARAIEQRLYEETWRSNGYDLIPKLRALDVPALVLHGDHDFIPSALAGHIADALPGGDLAVLEECGHFAYLEAPDAVRAHLAALLD